MPDAGIALSAVAGGLLGLLRMCQRHPDRVTEASVNQLAGAVNSGTAIAAVGELEPSPFERIRIASPGAGEGA